MAGSTFGGELFLKEINKTASRIKQNTLGVSMTFVNEEKRTAHVSPVLTVAQRSSY